MSWFLCCSKCVISLQSSSHHSCYLLHVESSFCFFPFHFTCKAPLSSTMPLVHLSHSPSYYLTWLREWERERESKRDNEVTTKENALISFNQALLLSRIVAGRQKNPTSLIHSTHLTSAYSLFDLNLSQVFCYYCCSCLLAFSTVDIDTKKICVRHNKWLFAFLQMWIGMMWWVSEWVTLTIFLGIP